MRPQQMEQAVEVTGDVLAGGVTVGAILQWLPALAALFTVLWTGMRIYEMITGRKFACSRIAQGISKLLTRL